jgi:hypothetical protein
MSICCRDKEKCGRYCAEIVTPEVHLHSNTKTTFCIIPDVSSLYIDSIMQSGL